MQVPKLCNKKLAATLQAKFSPLYYNVYIFYKNRVPLLVRW